MNALTKPGSTTDSDRARSALASLAAPKPFSVGYGAVAEKQFMNPFAVGNKLLGKLQDLGDGFDINEFGDTAATRRSMMIADPEILYAMVERGYHTRMIALILGFPTVGSMNAWLRANDLEEGFKEAWRESSELFMDAAAASMDDAATAIDQVDYNNNLIQAMVMAEAGNFEAMTQVQEVLGATPGEFTREALKQTNELLIKSADLKLKLGKNRFDVCMKLASSRNPSRYGASSTNAGAQNTAAPQTVSINMAFGEGEQKTLKIVNENQNAAIASLPSGIDLG